MNARSPSRTRTLLAEGRCLLTYAAGHPPQPWSIRRWLRALPACPEPLPLPACVIARPSLLRLVEPLPVVLAKGPRALEFTRRLYLAMVIAGHGALPRRQCQPALAQVLLEAAMVGVQEAAALTVRVLVHLLWWRR